MIRKKELTKFIKNHPGWTARQISDELLVATNRINQIIKETGLPIKRVKTSSKVIDTRITFIRAHPHWSIGDFSRKFQWSYCAIYKLCQYHKLEYRKVWSTEDEQEERIKFLQDSSHMTLTEMGQILGISIASVLKIIKNNNLKFFNKREGKITNHTPKPSKNRIRSLDDHHSLQSLLGRKFNKPAK